MVKKALTIKQIDEGLKRLDDAIEAVAYCVTLHEHQLNIIKNDLEIIHKMVSDLANGK